MEIKSIQEKIMMFYGYYGRQPDYIIMNTNTFNSLLTKSILELDITNVKYAFGIKVLKDDDLHDSEIRLLGEFI